MWANAFIDVIIRKYNMFVHQFSKLSAKPPPDWADWRLPVKFCVIKYRSGT